MFPIKKLYAYILQTFLPMFAMTFGIVLFILLMQFLWKYVEDLVGKGLDVFTLGEVFAYATLNLVPLALPLAILLASLITFGNMGENFELTAVKSAGVSLLKTMRPLIIFIAFVCVGAFYFQNDIVPRINMKLSALMISIRQKTPELYIPEGSFYNEISNYSIFVQKKDKETGLLQGVMIYDIAQGFDNTTIIVADSAKMEVSSHKDYLLLNLYSGQSFKNFKNGERTISRKDKFTRYSRENFKKKSIVITYNSDFNRLSDSTMTNSQISKNITQLASTIDSVGHRIDSLNIIDRKALMTKILPYKAESQNQPYATKSKDTNSTNQNNKQIPVEHNPASNAEKINALNFDSTMNSQSVKDKELIYSSALAQVSATNNDYAFRSMSKIASRRTKRLHETEWHRKFTLSFACLIFFFIGAPLGAIIRKGGLGMPVVVSVALFIVYYIIDNIGWKMARDGVWPAWQGVWLSSMVLFPLGAFLTYKAMNDSALFKNDAYKKWFAKVGVILGTIRQNFKLKFSRKRSNA